MRDLFDLRRSQIHCICRCYLVGLVTRSVGMHGLVLAELGQLSLLKRTPLFPVFTAFLEPMPILHPPCGLDGHDTVVSCYGKHLFCLLSAKK